MSPLPEGQAGALLEAFLRSLQLRNLSALTLKAYRQDLSTLFARVDRPVEALLAADLQPLVGQFTREGASPRSIRRRLAAWRAFFDWLMLEAPSGISPPNANPARGLRLPKMSRTLPKTLSVDAACAFVALEAPADEKADWTAVQDRALFELAYGCGLRLSEMVELDVGQGQRPEGGWLDLEGQTVHVFGKGRKRRILPLGSEALAALRHWLSVRDSLAPTTMALFLGARGARMSGRAIQRRFQRRSQTAGLGHPVHPHMLRHSFASHLLQSSGDLRAVQELLGHAQIATTQVYTHLDHQHLARVLDLAHPRAKPKSTQAE
ncbi:MAG: tyrosine recombinase XerC [Pseudomonadota bacterium]|jgi:integrase/recombinase XerC